MMENIARHLKRYLLWYSLLSIFLGWSLGVSFPKFAPMYKDTLSNLATILVFLMIYPMMINLNLGRIPSVMKKPKPVLISLIYNFVLTPLVAYLLVKGFIPDPDLALGFLLVMIVPGSSMSIGYTGLAEGDIEVATIALGINFVLIPIMLPLWLHILGGFTTSVPLATLIKTVVIVLILPMFLGDITRRLIIQKKGERFFLGLRPLFASLTMIVMFLVVGLIFFMKAPLLLKRWEVILVLAIVNIIYMITMLIPATWLDKMAGLSYEEHMGIIFLSAGKNNGTAIAIATLAFQPMVAIPAAVLPIFQIIFLILYLKSAERIKKIFRKTG